MIYKNIFTSDKVYEKNSLYFSIFLKKFLKKEKLNRKTIKVLDFGCGPASLHRYIKFDNLFLYDKHTNKSLSSNFYFNNFAKLKKTKIKFNLIIINSVVQYIGHKEFSKILNILLKKLSKDGIIFIGEIPRFNRFLELFMIMDPIKIFYLLFYFLKRPSYITQKYFFFKKEFFKNKATKNLSIKFSKTNSYFFKKRFCVYMKKT